MDFPHEHENAAQRRRMIETQLLARGISSPRVLEAMQNVPREAFMPAAWREEAYADRAAPIDCGQTISQPYMVALMTEALHLTGEERVLEIGTGSGYQTAVLSQLAREVYSVERHAELSRQAEKVLNQLGCRNVHLIVGDGTKGYPPAAPYDRIIVTAAADELPPALAEQLADNGWLVVPLGNDDHQILQALHKRGDELHPQSLTPCRFVPLVPEREAN
jgi:protein-L-isoaspartate(D-aspartate) O-methyltransferase